jgi:hypothetical protein
VSGCPRAGRWPPSPTLAAPWLPWWRGKVVPSPYIKGHQGEEEDTHQATSSPLLLNAPPPLSLSSYILCAFPEGLRRSENYATATCRRAMEIPDLIQPIYFCYLGRIRDRMSSSFTICVRLLRGVAFFGTRVIAPELLPYV